MATAMVRSGRTVCGAVVLLLVGAVGCGGDEAATGGEGGPPPSAMCEAPLVPVAAAYDLDTGAYRWHVCGEPDTWYALEAATDDTVYVSARSRDTSFSVLALDAATGTQRWRGDRIRMEVDLPADAARPTREPPTVDGVQMAGGQDDPLVATDAVTGAELWRNEDHLTYDDVWAVDDTAVYMSHAWGQVPQAIIRAYDLHTGAIRWQTTLDQRESYPWWVDDGRVFSVWTDLTVLSASDGEVLWTTRYPVDEGPDMSSPGMRDVLANDTTVFVSFASQPSGGD